MLRGSASSIFKIKYSGMKKGKNEPYLQLVLTIIRLERDIAGKRYYNISS